MNKREKTRQRQRAEGNHPKERQINRKPRMGWWVHMSGICVDEMVTASN